jgi:hypothetical protein
MVGSDPSSWKREIQMYQAETKAVEQPDSSYPASLRIDYPEQSNRLTVFFRLFTAIPILIIWTLLFGGSNGGAESGESANVVYVGVGMIYPRWWFDWNLNLARFGTRVFAYVLLLMDEYPSTDEEQAVHLDIPYPNAATDLQRGMPLIKWLLAIPHAIILGFLWIAVTFVSIIAWFAILITGNYPRGLFDFVVGVLRWELRVVAYAALLTTDQYPPFSLSE